MAEHMNIAAQPQQARKLVKSYFIGFILTVIFVLAAYTLVARHLATGESLYIDLGILLVLQVLALVVCFVRLNTQTQDDKWNLIIFIFTLIIMAIVVSGSLWIMYNLNYNMVN